MESITFDQLPKMVFDLLQKTELIERLLKELTAKQNDLDRKEGYWSVDDVAKFLKVSKATVYKLTSQKEIPFCKKGKRIYFLEKDVTEWVMTGRKSSISELVSDIKERAIVRKMTTQKCSIM